VRDWDLERLAGAVGAGVHRGPGSPGGPLRATIDSRSAGPGELFVGLRGERTDGGSHAGQALRGGAWGVLVTGEHAEAAAAAAPEGAVLVHPDPLAALQTLAREWRRELGARGASVIAITGSTGKTSTKDILASLLAGQMRVSATPENLNTEIGLPLALLGAPADSEAVVLEMAMRGPGQIAQLTAIAEPDVGVIVNVGPAHLELLGSLEAIAAAKAELVAGLEPGACAVLPAGEPLLEPHLRGDIRTITFGEGGDVVLISAGAGGAVTIRHGSTLMELLPSFTQAHQLSNLLAAVAAARAIGVTPRGPVNVRFSAMRGQRSELPGEVVLIDDCYNANPMSMRAAIDDLAAGARGRRVAVLGDMLELGAGAPDLHRQIGRYAAAGRVDVLVSVGPLAREIAAGFDGECHSAQDAQEAAEMLARLVQAGDTVLVKGSRGMGMESIVRSLREPAADSGLAHARGSAQEQR
jgi:UDP-N-acetylmuramoyl-tripeptide--D-alanyl-D-alanine ligase